MCNFGSDLKIVSIVAKPAAPEKPASPSIVAADVMDNAACAFHAAMMAAKKGGNGAGPSL